MQTIIALPLSDGSALRIESADDLAVRQSAAGLIARRYAWRGYGRFGLQEAPAAHRMTLAARSGTATLGTLTVVLDSADGLAVDRSFGAEVAGLRRQGRRIAEFTRLAVESDLHGDRVLSALFQVGHALAHRVHGHDLLLVEVNPRHVRYYARLLDAQVLATAARHASVDAPAVLLAIDLRQVQSRLAQAPVPARTRRRSPFTWAFATEQQSRIVGALQALSAAMRPAGLAGAG
jgi:hypothetical protein